MKGELNRRRPAAKVVAMNAVALTLGISRDFVDVVRFFLGDYVQKIQIARTENIAALVDGSPAKVEDKTVAVRCFGVHYDIGVAFDSHQISLLVIYIIWGLLPQISRGRAKKVRASNPRKQTRRRRH